MEDSIIQKLNEQSENYSPIMIDLFESVPDDWYMTMEIPTFTNTVNVGVYYNHKNKKMDWVYLDYASEIIVMETDSTSIEKFVRDTMNLRMIF